MSRIQGRRMKQHVQNRTKCIFSSNLSLAQILEEFFRIEPNIRVVAPMMEEIAFSIYSFLGNTKESQLLIFPHFVVQKRMTESLNKERSSFGMTHLLQDRWSYNAPPDRSFLSVG